MKNKLMNNMAKKIKEKTEKNTGCKDRLCPVHGDKKLKSHGRFFEGFVKKKLPGRVTIEFKRIIKIPKYERYEKRKTKIHARLPECMEKDVNEGDLILVEETRPISKTIHFVVLEKIGGKNESN